MNNLIERLSFILTEWHFRSTNPYKNDVIYRVFGYQPFTYKKYRTTDISAEAIYKRLVERKRVDKKLVKETADMILLILRKIIHYLPEELICYNCNLKQRKKRRGLEPYQMSANDEFAYRCLIVFSQWHLASKKMGCVVKYDVEPTTEYFEVYNLNSKFDPFELQLNNTASNSLDILLKDFFKYHNEDFNCNNCGGNK